MYRRGLLQSLGTATTGAVLTDALGTTAPKRQIAPLALDSTTGLLDPRGNPLTDTDRVAVRAQDSAVIEDTDGNNDAVAYGRTPIPLVATHDRIVGIGCPLVSNDLADRWGNRCYLHALWDEAMPGNVVLWDEGHDQYTTRSRCSQFVERVERDGYAVTTTLDLAVDLPGADGIVITTPSREFAREELSALARFSNRGGAVFIHAVSDYRDFDRTAAVNEIADSLAAGFRFTDGQVIDRQSNAGAPFVPVTDRVTIPEDITIATRPGSVTRSGADSVRGTVTRVADGDTMTIDIDGIGHREVRLLGIDTPETAAAGEAENPYEWEGLADDRRPEVTGDYPHLAAIAGAATTAVRDRLLNERVTLTVDRLAGVEDEFGRVLCYLWGPDKTLIQHRLLDAGLARVYDSSFRRHDEFQQREFTARRAEVGVWAESEPSAAPSFRSGPVQQVFVPHAVEIVTADGPLSESRVTARAAPSADPPEAPLIGLDRPARVALVGGLAIGDRYEHTLGFDADTSGYDNYSAITELVRSLTNRDGAVLIDGGHGQYEVPWSLSAESLSAYARHLEGEGLGLTQQNNLTASPLNRYQSLLIAAPARQFTQAELRQIRNARDNGLGIVILAAGSIRDRSPTATNALLSELGTDLRATTHPVTDGNSNLAGRSALPITVDLPGFSRGAVTSASGDSGPGIGLLESLTAIGVTAGAMMREWRDD